MSRLTDADKLHYHKVWIEKDQKFAVVVFAKEIDKAEIIDAVPVVRCKNCKHHEEEEPGMVYCPHIVGSWVSENFFCGFGERKDVDE